MNKNERYNFVIQNYKIYYNSPISINELFYGFKYEIEIDYDNLVIFLFPENNREIIPINCIYRGEYYIFYIFSKKREVFDKIYINNEEHFRFKSSLRDRLLNNILNGT